MRYQYAIANRLGNRSSNQDRCTVQHGRGAVLMVVADGMGGHARGELAAQSAVDEISRRFRRHRGQFEDPEGFLVSAMEAAHDEVVRAGMAQHPPIEPRTTCVACLIQGNRAWWAHVGDSRLYLLREARVLRRTRDHTYVEELVETGAISEEEIRRHPKRNCVTQCLGGGMDYPDITLGGEETLRPGDTLLLCSDGLWSALPEAWLSRLTVANDLNKALEQVAERAEQESYPASDNISAVLVRWLEHDESTSQPSAQEAADPGGNTLDDAIAEIHRALEEYGPELERVKK